MITRTYNLRPRYGLSNKKLLEKIVGKDRAKYMPVVRLQRLELETNDFESTATFIVRDDTIQRKYGITNLLLLLIVLLASAVLALIWFIMVDKYIFEDVCINNVKESLIPRTVNLSNMSCGPDWVVDFNRIGTLSTLIAGKGCQYLRLSS